MGRLVLRSSIVATPPGGDDEITPSLVVEYVDTSGVRQRTTVVDGVTSISGVAPFLVHFDASGTRSTETDADDEAGAFHNLGYHMAYGEAIGGTWSYPASTSFSKDEDYGPPIFGRAFTATGSHTVTLTIRDSAGHENSISLTVVVAASSTLTTVNIPVSNGAWPNPFTSSRRYTLDAGGDYTAFGDIRCDTLHNIVFEKTGSGADPIVSNFRPESRNYISESGRSSSTTRAANIRLMNIDAASLTINGMGFDYCGVINGTCRKYSGGAYGFYFDNRTNASQESQANSVRYVRGVFLWNCGQVTTTDNYVVIDTFRASHWQGVDFLHNTATVVEHNQRGVWSHSSRRNCRFVNTVLHKSWIKGQGLECWLGQAPDDWRDDDRVGDYAGGAESGRYGYPGRKAFFHLCQFGATGETHPNQPAGFGPQNNDAPPLPGGGIDEGLDLCGFEDCVLFASSGSFPEGESWNYSGRNLFHRNVKYNMGAGSNVPTSTSNASNKQPSGWDSYLVETTNTRPVPSTL